jgi:hypothetical protein
MGRERPFDDRLHKARGSGADGLVNARCDH